MRFVRGFARFWWDFVVGDDWRIAAGVVVVLRRRRGARREDAAPDGAWSPRPRWASCVVAIGSIAAARVGTCRRKGRRARCDGDVECVVALVPAPEAVPHPPCHGRLTHVVTVPSNWNRSK